MDKKESKKPRQKQRVEDDNNMRILLDTNLFGGASFFCFKKTKRFFLQKMPKALKVAIKAYFYALIC